MNIAILTAAGIGTRMNQTIPKQFMEIEGKPLIVYTIERFQKHPDIDSIIIVCLKDWTKKMEKIIKDYHLDKVNHIVEGGETGQESIYRGFFIAKDHYEPDSVVLVHDGNRPLVSEQIISDAISLCKQKGNAVGYIPSQEVLMISDDMDSSLTQIERDKVARTQTPHAFYLKDIDLIYRLAEEKGIKNSPALCSICASLGRRIYLYPGSEKNFKITTPVDIEIFKALIKAEKNG